ncbi:hypothetical protein CLOM_g1692 [Closterium sp. NIES-68]|nr:hypothetical protein CLOM_g1692 [Closterium sp. NIES-68]GJP78854.1 hypothetical protein CLOP_g9119 [Closterium sp. NIES-67]
MDGSVIHEPFPSFFLLGSTPSSSHSYYTSFSRSADFADHRMLPWTGGMSANVHFQLPTTYCTSIGPLKPVSTAPPAPAFPYRTHRFPASHSAQGLHWKRQSRGRERPIRSRSKGIRGYRIPERKFPRPGASDGSSGAPWWRDASPSSQQQQQQRQRYPRASVSSPAPLMPRSPRNTSSFIIRQHESLSSPAVYAATSPVMMLGRQDAVAAAFAGDSAASPAGAAAIAAAAATAAAGACATGVVPCDNGDLCDLGNGNSDDLSGLAAEMADMADMAPLLSVNPYGSMSGCIRLKTPEPLPYDADERSEGNGEGTRILPRGEPVVLRAECSEGASCSEDAPQGRAAHTEERVAVAGFDVRFFEVVCDMLVVAPACDADVPSRDAVACNAAAAAGTAACDGTAAAAAGAADGSDSILRARIDEQEAQMAQLEEENHSLRDRLEMRQEELRRLRMRLLSHNSEAIEMEGETNGTQRDDERASASTAAAAAVATAAAASPRRSASPYSAKAPVGAAAGECDDGYMSSS